MKKLSSTLPNMLLSLTLICLVVSFLLGALNSVTKKPIKEVETKAKVEAITVVVPAFDNNPFEEKMEISLPNEKDPFVVYPALKGGTPSGIAVESYTPNGFGGRVDVMVGFDMQDNIVDFSVLKHEETPGLGDKMQSWFRTPVASGAGIRDFRNLNMKDNSPLSVSKDGGKVDAITAATISSRAFLDAMERAYLVYKEAKAQLQGASSSNNPVQEK